MGPDRLKHGDLASLSVLASLGVGVFKIKGKNQGGSFFDQAALNLKLSLLNSHLFLQSGITLTQDHNSGTLGFHAPSPGFGLATGVAF